MERVKCYLFHIEIFNYSEGGFLVIENLNIPVVNHLKHLEYVSKINDSNSFNRIDIIDALKGYAIILVILGHIIVFLDPNNFKDSILFTLIYSFHMPLLFVLSGYLVYGKSINPIWAFIAKKFKGLFIPYLIWNIIGLLIVDFFWIKQDLTLKVFETFYIYSNLWFLPVLFFSFLLLILFIFLEKFSLTWIGQNFSVFFYLISYLIIMWLLVDQPPFQGFLPIRWFFPFVFVGYIIAKYKDYIFNFENRLFLISLFLFPILLPFWDIRIIQFADVGFIRLLTSFVLALSGIILSYYVIKLLKNTKIYDFFTLCGEFSLEIYIISNILGLFSQITNINFWFGDGIISLLSGTLIFLFFSLTLSLIFSYNKSCSTLLFGRWVLKHSPSNIKYHLFFLSIALIYIYVSSILLNISKTLVLLH